MARHNISAIIRRVKAAHPPDKRTARHMLVLLEATRQARDRSVRAISRRTTSGVPEEQRQQIVRDLTRLGTRLDLYAEQLSRVAPSDPMPESVVPLFKNILWTKETPSALRHPTPDFVTPFRSDNAAAELGSFYEFQVREFFRYLSESAVAAGKGAVGVVKGAADTVTDVVADAARGAAGRNASSALPWVLGGVGVLALGGVAYVAVTRR